jgi:hypothetical protein
LIRDVVAMVVVIVVVMMKNISLKFFIYLRSFSTGQNPTLIIKSNSLFIYMLYSQPMASYRSSASNIISNR